MAEEKPRVLKLDMMELTVLDSVEISLQERAGTLGEPQPGPGEPGDPNFAVISPLEPALSGFAPCDSDICY